MSLIKNNNNDYFKKVLYGLLEKIIFNEKDFDDLKRAINDINEGIIEPKNLREKIINSRVRILEELLEIFPFYVDQMNKKQSIDSFTNESENSELIKELKEKDEFLAEIGQKIDTIFKELNEKVEG